MSKFIDKRNSLERFIKEQTLGPGINGYRYVDLENEALVNKILIEEEPINEIPNDKPIKPEVDTNLYPIRKLRD